MWQFLKLFCIAFVCVVIMLFSLRFYEGPVEPPQPPTDIKPVYEPISSYC